MKPETELFLAKSREPFRQAGVMASIGENEAAGRAAYLAGFNAAQVLIFEREGRVFKTHRGAQGELAHLVKDDPRFDIDVRTFVGRAYNLKAIADYETGSEAKVTEAQAAESIDEAQRFFAAVESVIRASDESP